MWLVITDYGINYWILTLKSNQGSYPCQSGQMDRLNNLCSQLKGKARVVCVAEITGYLMGPSLYMCDFFGRNYFMFI